jgi:hypothetical protein
MSGNSSDQESGHACTLPRSYQVVAVDDLDPANMDKKPRASIACDLTSSPVVRDSWAEQSIRVWGDDLTADDEKAIGVDQRGPIPEFVLYTNTSPGGSRENFRFDGGSYPPEGQIYPEQARTVAIGDTMRAKWDETEKAATRDTGL